MSPRTFRAWRRTVAAVAVALVAALGTLFTTAAPASAHGQFVRSDPAAGAQVTAPLDELLLYFTEKPTSNAYFAVTTPTGVRVDRLWSHGPTAPIEPKVSEWYHRSDGTWVVRSYSTAYSAQIPIAYWPETGEYKVEFISVATDGQPVRGQFTFTYSGPITELPADFNPQASTPDPNLLSVAPPGAPTAPPTGPSIDEVIAQTESGPSPWIVWVPIAIVAAIAIAALIFWRMRPEQARELVVSRFGGRYAAPTPRRPLPLPPGLSGRLPARLQSGTRTAPQGPVTPEAASSEPPATSERSATPEASTPKPAAPAPRSGALEPVDEPEGPEAADTPH